MEEQPQRNIVWPGVLGVLLLVLGVWALLFRHGVEPEVQLWLGTGLAFGSLYLAAVLARERVPFARDLSLFAHGGFVLLLVTVLVDQYGFSGELWLLLAFLALLAAPGAILGKIPVLADGFVGLSLFAALELLHALGWLGEAFSGGGFQAVLGVFALAMLAGARLLDATQGRSNLSGALVRWGWGLGGFVLVIAAIHLALDDSDRLAWGGWVWLGFFAGLGFLSRRGLLPTPSITVERWALGLGLGFPLFAMVSSGWVPESLRQVLGFLWSFAFLQSLLLACNARRREDLSSLVVLLLTVRLIVFVVESMAHFQLWGSVGLLLSGGVLLVTSFAGRRLRALQETAAPLPAPRVAASSYAPAAQHRALLLLLVLEALVFGAWVLRGEERAECPPPAGYAAQAAPLVSPRA